MKKMFGMMLCLLVTTACTTEDGNYLAPISNDTNEVCVESKGEFAIDWVVNGETIDTTRLQVYGQAEVLNMPFKWLHQLIFPTAQKVTPFQPGADTNRWNMGLRVTGYSDSNVYYAIKENIYQHQVYVDGEQMGYKVFFSPDKSIAIYYRSWDAWSAIMPIDSITVAGGDDKEEEVRRFTPAISLLFNSTRRTKH